MAVMQYLYKTFTWIIVGLIDVPLCCLLPTFLYLSAIFFAAYCELIYIAIDSHW